jgi:Holliday junction resolvase RusA-like endonuclease
MKFATASLDIKPLSVNQCWRGRRFKTEKYERYEEELLFLLPPLKMPDPPYKIYFEFGFSSIASDWDNPVKPLQDILQKKYDFDDKLITHAVVKKFSVSKGKEYFLFEIHHDDGIFMGHETL